MPIAAFLQSHWNSSWIASQKLPHHVRRRTLAALQLGALSQSARMGHASQLQRCAYPCLLSPVHRSGWIHNIPAALRRPLPFEISSIMALQPVLSSQRPFPLPHLPLWPRALRKGELGFRGRASLARGREAMEMWWAYVGGWLRWAGPPDRSALAMRWCMVVNHAHVHN